MREIKFRGYDTADHAREWVTFTLDDLLSGSDDYELIDPDTVVQLIATDKNGNEVYEDDTVIGDDGTEWIVGVTSYVTSEDGFVHDIPLEFFTLKEADQ